MSWNHESYIPCLGCCEYAASEYGKWTILCTCIINQCQTHIQFPDPLNSCPGSPLCVLWRYMLGPSRLIVLRRGQAAIVESKHPQNKEIPRALQTTRCRDKRVIDPSSIVMSYLRGTYGRSSPRWSWSKNQMPFTTQYSHPHDLWARGEKRDTLWAGCWFHGGW